MTEGRYRIVRKLAEGGSGTTYLIWDKRLEQNWVMKRIVTHREGGQEAVRREMDALRRIRREGIPVLADVFYEKDAVCLIMEYMTGVSLEEMIKRDGPMEEGEAVRCALQIAEMLDFLHGLPQSLIHGDLKPSNLLCHQGRIALLDFGGASLAGTDSREQGYSYTPGYGAPELKADGQVSVRSDIYAFGAVLFYLVTGSQPEKGRGIYPVREEQEQLSSRLEHIILKCTEATPGRRYGSMAEVVRELQKLQQSLEAGPGLWSRWKYMSVGRDKKKTFRSLRSVLLTEGSFCGRHTGRNCRILLLFAVLLAGTVCIRETTISRASWKKQAICREAQPLREKNGQATPELLPVSLRNSSGEKLLVDFDAVYYTEEDPMFELPLEYFESGQEYEVIISQRERGKEILRERRFVICAGEPSSVYRK